MRSILASDPLKPKGLGPWGNEWVQKRLVRALQKRRVVGVIPDLRRLQEHVAARGQRKDSGVRVKLEDAIKVAIQELGGGKTTRT